MNKLAFIFVLLLATSAHAADNFEHAININGIGEVEAAVDNVVISAGIDTHDRNLGAAKDENQKKYSNLLSVIEKAGLAKAAIKSNFVSINPVYVQCFPTSQNPQPKCDNSKIDYYDVNRSVEIKLEDLTKYDALIEGLSEGGASNVNTGQYGVKDIGKFRDQARDMAIDAAKAKADKIAAKLNVKLGKPIHFESFDESAETPPRPMMMRAMAAVASAPATDVATMGKIKVVVNVNIAYGIE